jgi:hypothetical protein
VIFQNWIKNSLSFWDNSSTKLYVAFCLSILFYLARTAIPFFKIPFIIFYLGLILYIVIKYNIQLFLKLKDFFIKFFLLFILIGILVISFILSDKTYLIVFKDISNSIILLSFFFLMTILISNRNDLKRFVNTFLNILTIFSFVIVISSLGSLFGILSIKEGFFTDIGFVGSDQDFLSVDNNFTLLFVFFSTIFLISKLNGKKSNFQIILISVTLTLFSIDIFFSGSRRGLLLLVLLVIILIFSQLFAALTKSTFFIKFNSAIFYYFGFVLLFAGFLFWFSNCTSFVFKNKFLESIGSKNTEKVRFETSSMMLRYVSTFNKNKTLSDIYRSIWTPNLNPLDPDSGWGTRKHKTIFPLYGTNKEIIPEGSKGYLVDKSTESKTWNGNAYSFTNIFNENVSAADSLIATVYCYVSDNFDGGWAKLVGEGSIKGYTETDYNLKFSSTWQKLKIKVSCLNGFASIHLYVSKMGVDNLRTLNGYVIFAYPEIKIIKHSDKIVSSSGFYEHSFMRRPIPDSFSSSLKVIPDQNETGNIRHAKNYHVSEDPFFLSKDNKKVSEASFKRLSKSNTYYAGSLINLNGILIELSKAKEEKDLIRRWVSFIMFEDTTYHGFKKKLIVDTISNGFTDSRTARWEFAREIYSKEFTWQQKLFGGGFNFLNWYGYLFLKDKLASDWPHNPFLSILLYSGILGLGIYLFVFCKAVYFYLKYLKEFYLFLIFFLIAFFFSFFSSSSPFDPPIMGFFLMFPFFIKYINNKEKESKKNF